MVIFKGTSKTIKEVVEWNGSRATVGAITTINNNEWRGIKEKMPRIIYHHLNEGACCRGLRQFSMDSGTGILLLLLIEDRMGY